MLWNTEKEQYVLDISEQRTFRCSNTRKTSECSSTKMMLSEQSTYYVKARDTSIVAQTRLACTRNFCILSLFVWFMIPVPKLFFHLPKQCNLKKKLAIAQLKPLGILGLAGLSFFAKMTLIWCNVDRAWSHFSAVNVRLSLVQAKVPGSRHR